MTTRKHEIEEDLQSMEPPEEEKQPEIWTPPETLDVNTQRMAWQLLFERWKSYTIIEHDVTADWVWGDKETTEFYEQALRMAKIIREAEIKAGGQ